MLFKLKCPECGFAFSVMTPDDLTPEEIKVVKECPCGAQMIDDETIPPWNEIGPRGRSIVPEVGK